MSSSGSPEPTPDDRLSKLRRSQLKQNGWGYRDSKFIINKDGQVEFVGGRYGISGHVLTSFRSWMIKALNIDLNFRTPPKTSAITEEDYPAVQNASFLASVKNENVAWSASVVDRLFRAHGHTLAEISLARTGTFPRIPGMGFCTLRASNYLILTDFHTVDVVVWPRSHDEVLMMVQLANKHNVVIIPFGGGTSVSKALQCLPYEARMIVSLDTSQMNRILWVDDKNWMACVEAGRTGQDLENELAQKAFAQASYSTLVGFSA